MDAANLMLQAALIYIERGWAIFPTFGINASCCTCAEGAACSRPGKHPSTRHGHLDATTDESQIRTWFDSKATALSGRSTAHNIAIATGAVSKNMVVIDLDGSEGRDAWDDLEYQVLASGRENLPTRTVITGSNGRHLFFDGTLLAESGITIRSSIGILDHVDVRADGGYVIAPPSLHVSMRSYFWEDTLVPLLGVPAPPHPITDLLITGGTAAPGTALGSRPAHLNLARLLQLSDPDTPPGLDPDQRIVAGERDQTFFRLASKLRSANVSFETALVQLINLLNHRTEQPPGSAFTEDDVMRKLQSAYNRYAAPAPIASSLQDWANAPGAPPPASAPPPPPPASPASPALPLWDNFDGAIDTDRANGWRVAQRHGDHIHGFVSTKGLAWWMCAENNVWEQHNLIARFLAARTLEPMVRQEAMFTVDDDARDRLQKWAKRCAGSGSMTAAESQIAAIPGMTDNVPPEAYFDADPLQLATTNGVIDLRTGVFREIAPSDRVSRTANVAYDVNATCPRWDAFLEMVLPEPAVRDYVRLMLGMSIAGDDKDHVFMLCDGSGANGKSTLINVMNGVLGTYARAVPKSVFVARRDDMPPFDIVTMAGARFVTNSAELKSSDRLNDDLLKSIVSLELISVRKLFQDYFEMKPTGTLWLTTNYLPKLREVGLGLTRRLRRVRFNVTIPKPWNPIFAQEVVAEEGSGILNMLLAEYQRYVELKKAGTEIDPPEESLEDTRDYLDDESPFQVFLREVLEDSHAPPPPPGLFEHGKGWEPTTDLYGLYVAWCGEMGLPPAGESWFERNVGFDSKRKVIEGRGNLRLRRVNALRIPGDQDAPAPSPTTTTTDLASLYGSVEHRL